MKKYVFFLLLFLISCTEKKKSDNTISRKQVLEKPSKNTFDSLSIDSLWQIVKDKNGCLTGGQNFVNGRFGNEGCIMTNSKEWKALFNKPKKELTKFLLTKLEKTDTTKIHTCPFFLATEGEIAVYTLQGIHKKNWFDFEPYKKYTLKVQNEENYRLLGNRNSYQAYLTDSILSNKKELNNLSAFWIKELKE